MEISKKADNIFRNAVMHFIGVPFFYEYIELLRNDPDHDDSRAKEPFSAFLVRASQVGASMVEYEVCTWTTKPINSKNVDRTEIFIEKIKIPVLKVSEALLYGLSLDNSIIKPVKNYKIEIGASSIIDDGIAIISVKVDIDTCSHERLN